MLYYNYSNKNQVMQNDVPKWGDIFEKRKNEIQSISENIYIDCNASNLQDINSTSKQKFKTIFNVNFWSIWRNTKSLWDENTWILLQDISNNKHPWVNEVIPDNDRLIISQFLNLFFRIEREHMESEERQNLLLALMAIFIHVDLLDKSSKRTSTSFPSDIATIVSEELMRIIPDQPQ